MKRNERTSSGSWVRRALIVIAMLALLMLPAQARADSSSVANYSGLNNGQQHVLYAIAQQTWKFYSVGVDIDPTTNLPLDNVNFGATPSRGTYTSAANIGVYLWAVVAAYDLGLTTRQDADSRISATLATVARMQKFDGFLFQWYDTTTGKVIKNPGDPTNCATETPQNDNCFFVSNVDNGWYASGLAVVRQALPDVAAQATALLDEMNFGIFYDDRAQTHCNVNPAVSYQPTGQMYGGYYAGVGPAGYHNGALYSDPRIGAYMGMGLHQMPGDVWWRSWRTLPPPAPYPDCQSDPDFSWQGQPQSAGTTGYWQMYTDPQSSKQFNVFEGHYTYPGTDLTYVPAFGGGMFEGLMANLVVPETSWGTTSFGLNDLKYAEVQVKYATEQLHYPVWGISPSSTPDDTGGYMAYGAAGRLFPIDHRLAICAHPGICDPAPENAVTPHASFIALDVLPQEAFANIQKLRDLYPSIYSEYGFYDAVDPTTGSVGHRYLVLDQSMIMAALDNALNNRAMQRHFAADPSSWAAQTYLSMETMSIQ